MEKYRDILIYTISAISKIYLVYVAVLVSLLVLSLIIKKRKLRNAMLIFLACTIVVYAILVVPRFIDLHSNSFIKVENATIERDDYYNFSSDNMFFGHANIFTADGEFFEVSGIDLFELPPTDELEQFYGDVVYAEHSHQLIAMEKY